MMVNRDVGVSFFMRLLTFGVLIVMGMSFVVTPVGAETESSSFEMERVAGEDGVYREIIELSNYKGEPLQFKLYNGTFKSVRGVSDVTPQVVGNLMTSNSYFLPAKYSIKESYTNRYELEIESKTGDYKLEVRDSKTSDTAFDFTDMSIMNGNFVYYDGTNTSNSVRYFTVQLEKDSSYLYSVYSGQSFHILSPSGQVVGAYSSKKSRRNVEVSSVLDVVESGIYTIHVNDDINNNVYDSDFKLKIYEMVDGTGYENVLKINDNVAGQYLGERAFAVRGDESSSFVVNQSSLTGLNGESMSFKIGSRFDVNIGDTSYENPMGYRDMIHYRIHNLDEKNYQVLQYNTDEGTYANVIGWVIPTQYVELRVNSYGFAAKTGDSARNNIMELKPENRFNSWVGDPVDSFGGNFIDNRTLLSYSGNNPLSFELNYDSIANTGTKIGGGFTHNFETYLSENETGLDLYWSPSSVVRFTKDGESYTPVSSQQIGTMVVKTDDGYIATDKSKQEYVFDMSGKLVKLTDKVGQVTNYTYSGDLLMGVSNSRGQSFEFNYTPDALLSSVIDSTGRKLALTYTSGRLSKILTPSNHELIVSYVESSVGSKKFKVSKLSYDGINLVENMYDARGRVSYQYDAKRNRTTFTYDEYTDDAFVITTVSLGNHADTFVHDATGNLLSKTDGEGFTESYTYDANRNMISETDKNGQTFTYDYDELNRITKTTNPSGTYKSFSYDDRNNPTKITTEDGAFSISDYDDGKLRSVTDKLGFKSSYTYDLFGNILTISGRGDDVRNEYDVNGYLLSMSRGVNTTSFVNDGLGRVTQTTLPDGKIIKTTYDSDNNILTSTDGSGNDLTYTYNAFGNKLTSTDARGVVTTYTYDANGNLLVEKTGDREIVRTYNGYDELLTMFNRSGRDTKNKEEFTYNKRGELLTYRDADAKGYTIRYDGNGNVLSKSVGVVTESYTYDKDGNRVTHTDAKGNITTYVYDVLGNVVREELPGGIIQTYSYDAMNRLTGWTDGEGQATVYAYDAQGNLITETKPNGAITHYEYDGNNQQTAGINALGERRVVLYNALGQPSEIKNALGETVTQYEYDNLGLVRKSTDGNGHTNEFTYDLIGNLLTIKDGLGAIVETNEFNMYSEAIGSLDALGQTTSTTYDLFGNSIGLKDARGNVTTYTYSPSSRLTNSTDALKTTSEYKYDAFGLISSLGQNVVMKTAYSRDNNQNIIKDAFNLGAIEYAYDNQDNLIKETNARRQDTTYAYDKNGNVIQETSPEGITTHTYDSVGNRLSSVSGSDSIIRTYDLLGRVLTKTHNEKTIAYTYDARGHLTKMMYPDGKSVRYEYDVMGNLLRVIDWNENATTYEYNANNQLTKTTNWNGTSESREYDVKGQLIGLQNLHGIEILSSYTYAYDVNGNIIKENDLDLTYDALNRLLSVGRDAYTYSPYGNITSFTTSKDGQPYNQKMTYGYDSQLESLNGLAVSVDSDGNLKTYKLNGKTYAATYDSKNRMIDFDGVSYLYDSENNRVGLSVNNVSTNFVVDTESDKYSRVLVEETGDITQHHVYGNGLIGTYGSDGTFETNHYDYRGSVVQVSDESGTVLGEVSYDAYGVLTHKDDAVSTRFLYNGKYGVQTDSNGLLHMRARYYNPDLKRFMNRDVLSGNIEQSQTLNRYTFVNGNPISYIDPFGLAREMIANAISDTKQGVRDYFDRAWFVPIVGWTNDIYDTGVAFSEGDYKKAISLGAGVIITNKLTKNGGLATDDVVSAITKGYTKGTNNKSIAGNNVSSVLSGSKKVVSESNFVYFNKTHTKSLPKPKGLGPNGGQLQSHHGLQEKWAKNNLDAYGYSAGKAPTITIETGKGLPHTIINNRQNSRRDARISDGNGKWSSTIQDELGYIITDMDVSGFSHASIDMVLEQQYRMLDKLEVPYRRVR